MDTRQRDAILKLLPDSAFENGKQPHIDAYWTNKDGRYSLITSKWDNSTSWETRVIATALHNGECVVLRTEDAGRIREALVLLGAVT